MTTSADNAHGAIRLLDAWQALGHRLAAFAGALTALIALIAHVPVKNASLRGAGAWIAVLLLFRVGRWLSPYTAAVPAEDAEAQEVPATPRAEATLPR